MGSEILEIIGGTPLRGTVRVGGAKNAALPLLIASLLSSEPCTFSNVPNLQDVVYTIRLLEQLGATVERASTSEVTVRADRLADHSASYSLVKSLRASFWVLAPLLARGGSAEVPLPGGDAIGTRPVDIHLDALREMGAEISLSHGVVRASAPKGLHGAQINFRFPSVGATHQILMAASLVPETTVITGAAREPEVVALATMLRGMGVSVAGAGTSTITVIGARTLGGATVLLPGDRIEAGTYLLAGLASRGSVTVDGIAPEMLGDFLSLLQDMGVRVSYTAQSVTAEYHAPLRGIAIATAPFPGFATDLQAPLMAMLATASGTSTIEETIFEGRFGHVSELNRMGAKISLEDKRAIIEGVPQLTGCPVEGGDIRAAAALVIAALGAEGTSTLHEVHHLRRGYEYIERKISSLGGKIRRKVESPDDILSSGC